MYLSLLAFLVLNLSYFKLSHLLNSELCSHSLLFNSFAHKPIFLEITQIQKTCNFSFIQEPIIYRHCVRRYFFFSFLLLLFSPLVKVLVSVFYLLIPVVYVSVCQCVTVNQWSMFACVSLFGSLGSEFFFCFYYLQASELCLDITNMFSNFHKIFHP